MQNVHTLEEKTKQKNIFDRDADGTIPSSSKLRVRVAIWRLEKWKFLQKKKNQNKHDVIKVNHKVCVCAQLQMFLHLILLHWISESKDCILTPWQYKQSTHTHTQTPCITKHNQPLSFCDIWSRRLRNLPAWETHLNLWANDSTTGVVLSVRARKR